MNRLRYYYSIVIELLERSDIIITIDKSEDIPRGSIVRRVGNGKDQQGCYMNNDDAGDMILANVIDISDKSFVSPAGILVLKEGDILYKYKKRFGNDKASQDAMEIITEWPLYKKNAPMQKTMSYFIRNSFSPDQIIYMRNKEILDYLFIPVQQKFKVGRFKEIVNWAKVRRDKFNDRLTSLQAGEHITYVAMVPQQKSYSPMFYSIGTKPHQEIEMSLRRELFNFVPTHGGHIKAIKDKKGLSYLVDAGSNYFGKGINTLISTAEDVAKGLKLIYKDFKFIPVPGRGAFGEEQSY